MIDKNRTYKTRDGREVRIYATDGWSVTPVHGAIKCSGGWIAASWGQNGLHQSNDDNDLIEVRPRIKRTVWLNVHKTHVEGGHETEESAKWGKTPLARIKVEIDVEEGEGL